jgi:hypothetical protein
MTYHRKALPFFYHFFRVLNIIAVLKCHVALIVCSYPIARVEWQEYVEGLARKSGRRLPEVRRLAQDRDEYRKRLLKPDA